MPVLAFAMQKGGVGKTSSTASIGVELATIGKRVLLIDMDPQANLTQSVGVDQETVTQSIYEVLTQLESDIAPIIIQTDYGVDLAPATLSLSGAELQLASRIGRELVLRNAIASVRDFYDYILIDTPPSLGLLTIAALVASDAIIVPLQAHALAFKALPLLEETIRLARQLNPRLAIGGIAITMSNNRTNISQSIENLARETYDKLVFATVIKLAACSTRRVI